MKLLNISYKLTSKHNIKMGIGFIWPIMSGVTKIINSYKNNK